jgi:small subunit ribosomal protein S13
LQDRPPPWGDFRGLQQPAAQTASGLIYHKIDLSQGYFFVVRLERDADSLGLRRFQPFKVQQECLSMPRLLGVDIPNDRPTVISLTYLYGVGPKIARDLCHKAGIDPQVRARELHEDALARLAALLDKDYVVEGQLRRQRNQNIARLKDIACYRGVRHRRGLPVRGQRTRTNARTRKGPKKTVAGKKGVKDLR